MTRRCRWVRCVLDREPVVVVTSVAVVLGLIPRLAVIIGWWDPTGTQFALFVSATLIAFSVAGAWIARAQVYSRHTVARICEERDDDDTP